MKNLYIISLSCSFLILMIEGKQCPEKSRPHKTRCEAYYKCMDLPPKRHVWIPVKCQEGLVYEHKLYMCVLPPDDWECLQGVDENDKKNSNINENEIVFPGDPEQFLVTQPPEVKEMQIEKITEKIIDRVSNDDSFEGSGDDVEEVTSEVLEGLEKKEAKTEEMTDDTFTNIDPKFTKQLHRLSQLVEGLRKNQETKQALELRQDHLNTFFTNFNIKNHNNIGSAENYIPSPISSTTPAPGNFNLQLPFIYDNSSRFKDTLKPETKLILSNIFGFPDYGKLQMNAALKYNMSPQSHYHQSQEIPNISTETLNTVLELSKQLISNQNIPKVLPNGNYYNQAIIQPVIIPAETLPFHASFYNFQKRPNNKLHKKYNNKKPTHTIIHNKVHIETPSSAQKNSIVDSYGQLYPPLAENNQYLMGSNGQHNNIHTSVKTSSPSVSTEISVTTAMPLEFQVTPQTVEKYYTPSPYLTDDTANNLYTGHKSNPQFQYNNYDNQNYPYTSAALFPTQIDPNKIKIRPNAQHYDSLENESSEYFNYNTQSEKFMQNNYPQYLMHTTTTARPGYANYFPNKYEDAHMVHFGGNFVPYEIFKKSILPLLGPASDLTQVEFIHCAAGVRQPNTTDCTRYYVCNKMNGKVLSYSCPPYTAFNVMTRVCDARTYAGCVNTPLISPYSSSNTMLALQALQSQAMLQMLQNNEREQNNELYKESDSVFSGPLISTTTIRSSTSSPTKRKYYCKEGDKVADQTTSNSYFVCFKNSLGHMKGHKMTCPTGLIFCAVNSKCTLSERCK